jgi:hypothetical protein
VISATVIQNKTPADAISGGLTPHDSCLSLWEITQFISDMAHSPPSIPFTKLIFQAIL